LFEKHGIFEEYKAKHWSFGATPAGEAKIRFHRRIKKRYEDFLRGREVAEEGPEGQDEEQQFAAESDLRDFLGQNPGRIEPGLQLYESADRSGREYPVEGGFIDLLMIDRNQKFVVVELKVGRGRNRTIGQLLYYMGWVDKNLGKAPYREMIIAKEISEDLVIAVQRVPGVSLYRYVLSVSISPRLRSNLAGYLRPNDVPTRGPPVGYL